MNPDYNTLLRFYKAATGGGYQNAVPMPQPIPAQQPNILPPQTVTRVNGKASVDALKMSPNSSVLLLDTTGPIVWLCTSDGIGNVSAEAYDITPHKELPPIDVNGLENRIANIENILTNLVKGDTYDKSDDASVEPGEDELSSGKSGQYKKERQRSAKSGRPRQGASTIIAKQSADETGA